MKFPRLKRSQSGHNEKHKNIPGYIFRWLIGSKSGRRERLFLISEWNKRLGENGLVLETFPPISDWFVTMHSSKNVWNYLKIACLICDEESSAKLKIDRFRLNSFFFLFLSSINSSIEIEKFRKKKNRRVRLNLNQVFRIDQ